MIVDLKHYVDPPIYQEWAIELHVMPTTCGKCFLDTNSTCQRDERIGGVYKTQQEAIVYCDEYVKKWWKLYTYKQDGIVKKGTVYLTQDTWSL